MKPLRYKKKATTIFAEVKEIVQHLQSAVTKQWIIWDRINLVVTLDSLQDDFEMTTVPFLYSGDKDIEEIQQIVTSTKVANLAKRTVGVKANLTMMAKKKQSEKSDLRQNEEYFNCGKKSYYVKDCHSFTCNSIKKKPAEESIEKAK